MNPLVEETLQLAGADLAEEMLPSMPYARLVEKLGPLTALGVLAEGSLPAMLVVARLIDRRRIVSGGLSASELEQALRDYRHSAYWSPLPAVESALEEAIRVVRESENKAQAAA